jgi:hypothetical protein
LSAISAVCFEIGIQVKRGIIKRVRMNYLKMQFSALFNDFSNVLNNSFVWGCAMSPAPILPVLYPSKNADQFGGDFFSLILKILNIINMQTNETY